MAFGILVDDVLIGILGVYISPKVKAEFCHIFSN